MKPLPLSLLSTLLLNLPLTKSQYTNQSLPFTLHLTTTTNETLNNATLTACHTGAAIESLCIYNHSSPFTFNTTDSPSTPQTGLLTYDLPSTPPIPSSLTFFIDPTSNFALPLLFPGHGSDSQTLAFDDDGFLGVWGYVDYGVSPPKPGPSRFVQSWWVCETYFTGYVYVNLVWGLGGKTPEIPGCVGVGVRRVFV